ncbi:MAG: hypothetical protein IJ165_06555, partial [Proteobacteria bacterium]|nr:hypothetical protein [Pseudomonadota bacterium]
FDFDFGFVGEPLSFVPKESRFPHTPSRKKGNGVGFWGDDSLVGLATLAGFDLWLATLAGFAFGWFPHSGKKGNGVVWGAVPTAWI